MTKLSVNINKIATLRNARGGDNPNVIQVAKDCERFGANGITVHPRPDERHITRKDTIDLKKVVGTEYNIEGYPDQRFIDLVLEVNPDQATLVPDKPDAITSDHGWNTVEDANFLRGVIARLKKNGIRVSVFIDPSLKMVEGASVIGADRVELYTEPYAQLYQTNPSEAIKNYIAAAELAKNLGLGINAGHDLNLENLKYFVANIPHIMEVSIGHALICDSLYLGLENTIQLYLRQLLNEA